jgi:hypothetical protein
MIWRSKIKAQFELLKSDLKSIEPQDNAVVEISKEDKYLIAQEMYDEYCASSGD